MKRYFLLPFLMLLLFGCRKECPDDVDYRQLYVGSFDFMCRKSTMVMCYDTNIDCVNGWKEQWVYTNYLESYVDLYSSNRVKIQFGDAIIGINVDTDDSIKQTIFPILLDNGDINLPEYPIGGHNHFIGKYIGYDTIEINLQYGYSAGGYDKYKVIGTRMH